MNKKIVLFLLVLSLFVMSVSAFDFTGYVKDIEGNNVANANVTLTEEVMGPGTAQVYSALADSNGYFTVSANDSVANYNLQIINYSSGGITALLVNKVLPPFPTSMYNTSLNNQTFYLQNATTVNITVADETHGYGQVQFHGFVMDSKYNFPIKQFVTAASPSTQELVVVPVGKSNYTIQVFKIAATGAFYPKTVTFEAETQPTGVLNHTQINVSANRAYVYGHILHEDGSNFSLDNGENITVIRSYFKSGEMLDLDYGYVQGTTDTVDNVSDAVWYNITLLDGNRDFIVTIFANNSSADPVYYAGFQNFSTNASGFKDLEYNITAYPLTGAFADTEGINTSYTTFKVWYNNTTDLVAAAQTFAQFKVYNYTGSEGFLTFTKNTNLSGDVRMFLRNDSAISVNTGVEVFNQQFPPRKFSYTNAQLAASEINLTLKSMDAMTDADGNFLGDVQIEFFTSSATCDVPGTPPTACELFEITNTNPDEGVKVLLSPGDVSIRLTKSTTVGDIVVHYINVDMLASGPPDMEPSTAATANDSGGDLQDVWKFGSMGPSAYESLIIGIPYNDTRMDDAYGPAPTILFDEIYDVQNSWDVIWNSTDDRGAEGIAGNFSTYPNTYTDFDIRWFNHTGGGMPCSFTNTSEKCYIDKASNMMWLRVAHFSGVGPQVRGYSTLGNISTDDAVYSCWQDSATTQGCSVEINITVNESSTWADQNWSISINNTASGSGLRYNVEWLDDSSVWVNQNQNSTFINSSNNVGYNLSVGLHRFRLNVTLPTADSVLWNFSFSVNETISYSYNVVWLDSINLTDPPTRNITTDQTPLFNFTLFSENWTSQSCTLNIGGTDYTNSTVTNGTAALITPTNNLADGNYTYNITCNVSGTSANRWVYINDTTAPSFSVTPAASSLTTSGATLTATTNEAANCKYSTSNSVGYSGMTLFGTTTGTVHSHTLTELSAGTDYTYYVRCADTSGNINQGSLATVSFTTSSFEGGGGVGGAGGGTTTSVVGDFAKEVWSSINAGETAVVEVANSEIGITGVSFGVDKTTYGAWLKVEKITSLPSTVKSYDGKVYKNIKISESNVQKVLKGEAAVNFKVAKSWLSENGLSKENVALYRYAKSRWNKLATTVGKDDGTHIHYTARTPGFSYFVIGGKVGVVAAVAEEAVEEVVEEVAEEVPEAVEEVVEEVAEPAPEVKKLVWPWVVLVIIILGVISWLIWKKKGTKKKK